MVSERCAKFPDHAHLIHAYIDRWLETIPGPVPGVHDLVRRLAACEIPLYAITNFGTEFWTRFRPGAPILDHFHDIVISGAERLIKPDPAIYRLAIKRFNLAPADLLFIDDHEENVHAAEAEGIIGHHFCDAQTLAADLLKHKLLGRRPA